MTLFSITPLAHHLLPSLRLWFGAVQWPSQRVPLLLYRALPAILPLPTSTTCDLNFTT
ncbi:uncharacterized protein LACBIDRAFT_312949 [Laccaria bicolor S238N-H82]|uniref:Predicted protein n=1 Tax=Laccaria bicolor (strain S238N-H82 / ATCC MYA-4686) TaxID=486041 RepID=B0DX67_LACBS|nr:uncharacterized protein LACBIDRAFT_312949 [Laccaria bicolor S238N-H82]EDR00742.1 predicted protein [Laccaria bicolor S238N-H82]|eukprot:XP_001888534.1 predicted protein [Laccaria bicolor S238N-H82]